MKQVLPEFWGIVMAVTHPEPAACMNPSIALDSASRVEHATGLSEWSLTDEVFSQERGLRPAASIAAISDFSS